MQRIFLSGLLMVCSVQILPAQTNKALEENQLVDISERQLELFEALGNMPRNLRDKTLLDSLYSPFPDIWKRYWDSSDGFITWVGDNGLTRIEEFKSRSIKIDRTNLEKYWNQTLNTIVELTDYVPAGGGYLYFGTGNTNLQNPDFRHVYIDLNLPEHFNATAISELFPHYISKMIFAEQQGLANNLAHRIINGGLACYVTYQFHKGAISKAEALGYDNEAFEYCVREEEKLFELLSKLLGDDLNLSTVNTDTEITQEISRMFDIIGYYVGLRIVEAYVMEFGKDSWRELYKMNPKDAILQSGLLLK